MTDPIVTDEAPKKKAPALWKQLLGAGGGALVAFGLYSGYQWSTQHVDLDGLAGYLTPPGWEETSVVPEPPSKRDVDMQRMQEEQAYEMQRIASEAARMAAQMSSASMASAGASAMDSASEPMAMAEDSASSQASSGRSQWRTGSRWSAPSEESAALARAAALPDSGLPLVGLIGAAVGGAIMRRRKA